MISEDDRLVWRSIIVADLEVCVYWNYIFVYSTRQPVSSEAIIIIDLNICNKEIAATEGVVLYLGIEGRLPSARIGLIYSLDDGWSLKYPFLTRRSLG